jgi:hypothetical protein
MYSSDQFAGVQTQINNIVNAIANGMFHPSMKEKIDELEVKRPISLSSWRKPSCRLKCTPLLKK